MVQYAEHLCLSVNHPLLALIARFEIDNICWESRFGLFAHCSTIGV